MRRPRWECMSRRTSVKWKIMAEPNDECQGRVLADEEVIAMIETSWSIAFFDWINYSNKLIFILNLIKN